MEHRPFGRTGLEVSAVGFGCWEVGGGYGQVEEAEFGRGRRAGARPRHQLLRHRRGLRHGRVGAGARRGARQPPRRGDRRHEVRHELPRQAEPPRQQPRARAGVDRQEPEEPRHRLRRRLPRALARPRDAVRGDDGARSKTSCATARCASSASRTSSATRSRRACATRRVDVVQYGWNMFDRRMQREILPYCEEHGIGFMAYGSLAFGLLTGTFTEDMDFGAGDWRARQGKMGSIKMFEALFGAESFPRNVRAVEELKAHRRTVRQEPPAARAAMGDLASRGQHRARRVPHRRRGRGQRRRRRLGDRRRRPRRDRRDLRAPRRSTPVPEFWIEDALRPRDGRARRQGRDRHGRRGRSRPRDRRALRRGRRRASSSPTSTPNAARRSPTELGDAAAFQQTDVADADAGAGGRRLRRRAVRRAARHVSTTPGSRARAGASSTTTCRLRARDGA